MFDKMFLLYNKKNAYITFSLPILKVSFRKYMKLYKNTLVLYENKIYKVRVEMLCLEQVWFFFPNISAEIYIYASTAEKGGNAEDIAQAHDRKFRKRWEEKDQVLQLRPGPLPHSLLRHLRPHTKLC